MISSLNGEVLAVNASGAVIDVGGVGFAFSATFSTLSHLHVGAQARVLTTLIVREDSLTLYGFTDSDERDVFNALLGVSGIGAKIALAALGVLTPNQLRRALIVKDEKTICKVPGIGPKVAKRIILEIGDKLGTPDGENETSNGGGTENNKKNLNAGAVSHSDVLSALVNLGWHEREADSAVNKALAQMPDGTVAELLRLSLQILGSRR
ncbi:Holliday junction branch migration protein RuvA [Arcanobacterium hippocoleae]